MSYSVIISKIFNKVATVHWLITILSFVLAFVLYPQLPQQIPVHFDSSGGADSFGNRLNVFILPVALVILGVLCSSKVIDRRYADLTIQNIALKTLLLIIILVVWYGTIVAFLAYYHLAK